MRKPLFYVSLLVIMTYAMACDMNEGIIDKGLTDVHVTPRSYDSTLFYSLMSDTNMIRLNELLFKRNYLVIGACSGDLDWNKYGGVDSLIEDYASHEDLEQLYSEIEDHFENEEIVAYLDSVLLMTQRVILENPVLSQYSDSSGIRDVLEDVIEQYVSVEHGGVIIWRNPCEECWSTHELCIQNAAITGWSNFAGGLVITLGVGVIAAVSAPPTVGVVLVVGLFTTGFNAGINYAGAVNICDNNLQYCLNLHECPGAGNPKSGCEYFTEPWE